MKPKKIPTPQLQKLNSIQNTPRKSLYNIHPLLQKSEGQLYTDRAPDGQKSFHTTLHLVTKQGCKSLSVKVDPNADVNSIPLSRYQILFPSHFTKAGSLKPPTLKHTNCIWSPHDSDSKPFPGYLQAKYSTRQNHTSSQ